jgi:CHAT domain-containing protein
MKNIVPRLFAVPWLSVSVLAIVISVIPAKGQNEAADASTNIRAKAAALVTQGSALLNQKTPESIQKAIASFQQAFALSRELKDPSGQAQADSGLGFAHLALHELSQALALLAQARDLSRIAGDKRLEASCIVSLGVVYAASANDAKAINFFQQGQAAWHSIGDASAEAMVFRFEGLAYSRQKDLPRLIAAYEQSLALFRTAENPPNIAQTLLDLGQNYSLLNQQEGFQKAVASFSEAATVFHSVGNIENEAVSWWGLGTAHDRLSQPEQARAAYIHALALFNDPKSGTNQSAPAQGRLLYDIASDNDALQDYDAAEAFYRRAIPVLSEAKNLKQQALAEVRLGDDLAIAKQRSAALEAYQAGLSLSLQSGDDFLRAMSYSKIAMLYIQTSEWQRALDNYQQALAISQKTNDRVGEVTALQGISGVYQQMGDAQGQLDYALRVLDMTHDEDSAHAKAVSLLQVGDAYNRLGRSQLALEYLNRSLVAYGNYPIGRETVLAEIGQVYTTIGDMKAALKYANDALDITHSEHNARAEQKVLEDIGQIYWWLGDLPRALAIYQKNLTAARQRNDLKNVAVNLNNIALLYSGSGDYKQAEPLFLESLALARQTGDRGAEAITLSGLGMVYNYLGHEQQALETLNQALAIQRELKDQHSEAITLDDLGTVYEGIGQTQKALEAGDQAVTLLKQFGDEPEEAMALGSMASTYHRLGIYGRAGEYFQQALTIQQRIQDPDSQMRNLNNLAVLAEEQHDETAAVAYYNRSLELARKLGNRGMEAYLLATIAMSESGDSPTPKQAILARARIQSALEIARSAGDVNSQALATYNIGFLIGHSGSPAQALPYLRQAIPMWKTTGNIAFEKAAQSQIAREELKLGRLEPALADVDKAIQLDESQRSQVKNDSFRASYFSTANSDYALKIEILMALHQRQPAAGYDAKALATSEQARARSLLDLLSQSHTVVQQGADPALLASARAAENTLNAKEAERARIVSTGSSSEEQAALQRIDSEIEVVIRDYAGLQDKIRIQSPAYANLTQPLTLSQIQKQVLDPGTILLEYSLGEQRSFLFAVDQTSLTTYVLPGRTKIERSARDFYELISKNNQDREELERTGNALSGMLLGPVAAHLGNARLVIVGDGKLQEFVPFAALPLVGLAGDPARTLITEHEILTEPSASAVAVLRQGLVGRADPSGTVAVLADPVFQASDPRLTALNIAASPTSSHPEALSAKSIDSPLAIVRDAARGAGINSAQGIPRLPHTREEARSILALTVPAQSFEAIGFDATKVAASNPALANYRIVHFATHGFLDAGNPDLSGLVFSLFDNKGQPIDGFLRLNDIFALKLPVDLVVLSACESGQGTLVTGEGLMGLTRGFFHAGAASLAVTLWSVDDAATAELMTRFYQGLLGPQKLRPAVALRAAQLAMAGHNSKYGQPYYWASFTIEGEWH